MEKRKVKPKPGPAKKAGTLPSSTAKGSALPLPKASAQGLPWFIAPKSPAGAQAPKKPLIANPLLQLFLASLAIYIVLFVFLYSNTPPLSLSFSYSEEPLLKNSNVGFAPGDSFAYIVTGSNGTADLRYDISTFPGCPIEIADSSGASYCIDRSGAMLVEKGGQQPNGTLGFFGAWMLAVGPGWEWHANVTSVISNMSAQATQLAFSDLGAETALGRQARKIRVSITGSGSSSTLYCWIDEEKRVLVRALMPDGSKIELSSNLSKPLP